MFSNKLAAGTQKTNKISLGSVSLTRKFWNAKFCWKNTKISFLVHFSRRSATIHIPTLSLQIWRGQCKHLSLWQLALLMWCVMHLFTLSSMLLPTFSLFTLFALCTKPTCLLHHSILLHGRSCSFCHITFKFSGSHWLCCCHAPNQTYPPFVTLIWPIKGQWDIRPDISRLPGLCKEIVIPSNNASQREQTNNCKRMHVPWWVVLVQWPRERRAVGSLQLAFWRVYLR